MDVPAGATVILHQPTVTGQDEYGNDVVAVVDTPVSGVIVWPTGSSERDQGQTLVLTDRTVIMPTGTVVTAVDTVTLGGLVYQVDGDPFAWVSPFTGWAPGVEVHLKRATG